MIIHPGRLAVGAATSAALIGMLAILPVRAGFGEDGTAYPWQERAARIEGIVDFRTGGTPLTWEHDWASLSYEQDPPVGGDHSPVWQQCMGNVYDGPIAKEHAVHSLEHGAVWLAYRPDLAIDEVEVLAGKVEGKPYTLMAPYDGLDTKISLQAWGYQLKAEDADDPRIDEFITALAENASIEPEATCSGGNTATGAAPLTEPEAFLRLVLGSSAGWTKD